MSLNWVHCIHCLIKCMACNVLIECILESVHDAGIADHNGIVCDVCSVYMVYMVCKLYTPHALVCKLYEVCTCTECADSLHCVSGTGFLFSANWPNCLRIGQAFPLLTFF